MDITTMFAVLSGFGLLALTIGAFGVLDALNGRDIRSRRGDWLVTLFAAGVLFNVAAYTVYGRWYLAAPLALLLLPADRAIRVRAGLRRRRSQADSLNGSEGSE